MKKIKLNKNISKQLNNALLEDTASTAETNQTNNTQTNNNLAANNAALSQLNTRPTITPFIPDLLFSGDDTSDLNKLIDESLEKDAARDNCLVKIILTNNIYKDIAYPNAPMLLSNLLQSAEFPDKFYNVHAQLDADPLDTILHVTDEAINCFTNTKFDLYTDNVQNSANESYEYVNEDIITPAASTLATAANVGMTAGSAVASGVAIGGAAVAGAALPLGIAGMTVSKGSEALATLMLGSDHGRYVENDGKLKREEYAKPDPKRALNSDDPDIAIDEYIKRTYKYIALGLKQMTPPSQRSKINELEKVIISLMGKAGKRVEAYIQDNDDLIKRKREFEDQERLQKAKEGENIAKLKVNVLKKYGKPFTAKENQEFDKCKNEIELAHFVRDILKMTEIELEGINYDFTLVLNEEFGEDAYTERTDVDLPEFNATEIYKETKNLVASKMTEILTGDEEEWPDIKWARKLMEELRDAANTEITTRIDLVCRTGSSDNLSASSKVAAFIKKHPMRANGLKGVWARHMKDLNMRIESRIKHIYNPNGLSPMSMSLDFLKNTYPAIVGMMVTYKAILMIARNEKLMADPNRGANITKLDKTAKQLANEQKQAIALMLEVVFEKEGGAIIGDDKDFYDEHTHMFTPNVTAESPILLGLLLAYIIKADANNKRLDTPTTCMEYVSSIKDLHSYIPNSPALFFGEFTRILLQYSNGKYIKYPNNLYNIFAQMRNDRDRITKLLTIRNKETLDKIFTKDNIASFNYIIANIRASKGAIFAQYEKNKALVLKLTADSSNSDKGDVYKALGLKNEQDGEVLTILNDLNERITDATLTDIRDAIMLDPYVGLQELYYSTKLFEAEQDNAGMIDTCYKTFALLASNISLALGDEASKQELIQMYENIIGTSGDDSVFNYLHTFNDDPEKDKEDIDDISEYWDEFTKEVLDNTSLKIYSTDKEKNDFLVQHKITKIDSIGILAGLSSVTKIRDIISKFNEDDVNAITNPNDVLAVMKIVLDTAVADFDNEWDSMNSDMFDDLFNAEQHKSILIGVDSNNQKVYVTLPEFCMNYHNIVNYFNNSQVGNNDDFKDIVNNINTDMGSNINRLDNFLMGMPFISPDENCLFCQIDVKHLSNPTDIKDFIAATYCPNGSLKDKNALYNAFAERLKDQIFVLFANACYGNAHGPLFQTQTTI